MKREEETSHQESFRKGVLMNEKGVGATGKESLWEAVRRGLAGSTLKLAPLLPSVTNTFTHEWLKASGLILGSAAGASGGKHSGGGTGNFGVKRPQLHSWLCHLLSGWAPNFSSVEQVQHYLPLRVAGIEWDTQDPAWRDTGTQGTLQTPVSTLYVGECHLLADDEGFRQNK